LKVAGKGRIIIFKEEGGLGQAALIFPWRVWMKITVWLSSSPSWSAPHN
jgi:hypothetical protein